MQPPSLHDVDFTWADGTPVFAGLRLHIPPGRSGLVGVNGSGKSTLLRLLAGDLAPTGGHVAGVAPGEVGHLSQCMTLEESLPVDDYLGIAGTRAAVHRLEAGSTDEADYDAVGDRWDIEDRAASELRHLGLPEGVLDRTLGELSGGEVTQLAIARLLMRRPRLLLLDEPTNNLDRVARERLYAVVSGWRGALDRFWSLPTGSRIEYRYTPARTGARDRLPPVVFLHGGPGVSDVASDMRYFAPLSAWGHDVYTYAQLGSGLSSRLSDPAGFGRDRDVADLEAIRKAIHAPRIVLVGLSYGGALAAAHAARFPRRVADLVLVSPMPLDPADHSPAAATSRLDRADSVRLYRTVLPPRALLTTCSCRPTRRQRTTWSRPGGGRPPRRGAASQRARPALRRHRPPPDHQRPAEAAGLGTARTCSCPSGCPI